MIIECIAIFRASDEGTQGATKKIIKIQAKFVFTA